MLKTAICWQIFRVFHMSCDFAESRYFQYETEQLVGISAGKLVPDGKLVKMCSFVDFRTTVNWCWAGTHPWFEPN